jgi:hypothetical protein
VNLLQIHEPGETPEPHAGEADLAIGIDLGTTNTVAAIATEGGPEVLRGAICPSRSSMVRVWCGSRSVTGC